MRAFGKHFVVVSLLSITVVVGIFTALPYQSAASYDPRFFNAWAILMLLWLGYSIFLVWPVILLVFLAARFFRRGESIARYESKGEVLRAFGKHFVVVSSLSIAVVVGIFTALPYQSAAFYDHRFFIAIFVLLLGWLGYSIFLALSRRMIIFVCWVVFSFAFALLFLAAEEILLKEENEAAQLSTAETDAHFAFSYFENKETRPYPDWCGMIGTANELPESKQNCGFSREFVFGTYFQLRKNRSGGKGNRRGYPNCS